MSYGQGDVVVAADPFGHEPRRPCLIVSNESRPFQGEDYLVAGITTAERDAALPLDGGFEAGDRASYVSPWVVPTIGSDHVSKRVAVAASRIVEETAEAIENYVEPG